MPDSPDQPLTPTEPGWYPDPWSATGHGERYFDGNAWGKTDRPVGREVGPLDDTNKPAKFRRRRKAGTSTSSPGRFRRSVMPFGFLIVTAGLIWGIGQVNQRNNENAAESSSPPSNNESAAESSTPTTSGASDFVFDHPPPSVEAKSSPLGTPGPVPDGGGAFEFIRVQEDDPSTPVAFDPCRPIHYVIRPDGAPPDGEQLIQEAVARVSTATGLQFIYDGVTTEFPESEREPYQPDRYDAGRWAPVVIAWSDEAEEPSLAGYTGGFARPYWLYTDEATLVTVTGTVLLDRFDFALLIKLDREAARGVITHELGHLVGLDHVADRTQLMFPDGQPGVTELGAGDLAGLAILGTQACFPEL